MERHPSLDDRFDPAIRITAYDRGWPVRAGEELRRVKEALVARHPRERLGYIAGKDEYVAALQERAVKWARGVASEA